MTHAFPKRLAGRILALYVLASFSFATLGGPLGLYGCHFHAALAAVPADSSHDHHRHNPPTAPDDAGEHSDRCDCAGMCTQPTPALLPVHDSRPAALEAVAEAPVFPDRPAASSCLAFLPFATGPPSFLA